MTDKELEKKAEQYSSKYARQYYHNDKSGFTTSEEEVCKAYIAGLKAGKPQWHNVIDGDLPKEKKEYWCKVFYYESEETFNAFLWFDPSTKEFKLDNIEEDEGSGFNVKEWREIPEE